MPFERRILHHGPSPTGVPQLLSQDAIRSAWFELHRQGGCGSGEIQLADNFDRRDRIVPGDWISFESAPGARWYLGRVEERRAEIPAKIRLRLEGMAVELNEIFPGGFGEQADGQKPHRYAATDLFPYDPDHSIETQDQVQSVEQVVCLLMEQYVAGVSHIQYHSSNVESPALPAVVESMKFRGEESVRSILKELAVRAQSASWGVDQFGNFFFRRPRNAVIQTYREKRDLISLTEASDREFLFNRVLLTGDYVYDRQDVSGGIARRSYRWRGNFVQRTSQQQHGDRRIRIWMPWIRSQEDSISFAKEFFRSYSQPASRYFVETAPISEPPVPWSGAIHLENSAGDTIVTARVETVRVLFDHALRVRLELGPDDPRNLWPEPPHDERWELPDDLPSAGGDVSLPPTLPSGDPPPGSTSEPPYSSSLYPSSPNSSLLTSLTSSLLTSSQLSSNLTSSMVSSSWGSSVNSSQQGSSSATGSTSAPSSQQTSSGMPTSASSSLVSTQMTSISSGVQSSGASSGISSGVSSLHSSGGSSLMSSLASTGFTSQSDGSSSAAHSSQNSQATSLSSGGLSSGGATSSAIGTSGITTSSFANSFSTSPSLSSQPHSTNGPSSPDLTSQGSHGTVSSLLSSDAVTSSHLTSDAPSSGTIH